MFRMTRAVAPKLAAIRVRTNTTRQFSSLVFSNSLQSHFFDALKIEFSAAENRHFRNEEEIALTGQPQVGQAAAR